MIYLLCILAFGTGIGILPWSMLTTALAVWVSWEILKTAPARYRAEKERKANR